MPTFTVLVMITFGALAMWHGIRVYLSCLNTYRKCVLGGEAYSGRTALRDMLFAAANVALLAGWTFFWLVCLIAGGE